MYKLINSVDGAVTDVIGDGTGALRGRAHGSRGAAVAVPAGRADSAGLDAAHPARAADDAERPEITRSWGAPVSTPALRWER